MTRDQLRLVLQPDDQLVKIKTVTAIDDHSDGEQPGVEQDLQSRQAYFALIHCDRNPTHLVALAALLVRRIGRLC
jgi:hypothetical protein